MSSDVVGAEYAAIIKNIYAILTGVCSGLGYGDNFIAVLITSSANELNNLLMILDAKNRTITKAAYLGDLLVTCYSAHSRNRSLGFLIGKGLPLPKALSQTKMVAEGYHACASIYKILINLKINYEKFLKKHLNYNYRNHLIHNCNDFINYWICCYYKLRR